MVILIINFRGWWEEGGFLANFAWLRVIAWGGHAQTSYWKNREN